MSHLHHKVSALIDGELTPSARSRALRHLRGCAQCRREIAETLEVKRRLTKLPPAELPYDLRAMAVACPPAGSAACPPSLAHAIRRVAVSLGSMSALVIALAYIVGAPEVSQAREVTPPVNEFTAEFTDTANLPALSDPAIESASTTSSVATAPMTFASPSPAERHPGSLTHTGDDPKAVHLLRRAVAAPQRTAFNGVRICQSFVPGATQSYTIDVRHSPDQGTLYDVISGPGRNTPVFVPARGDKRHTLADQPIGWLLSSYDIQLAGTDQVAGRRATVVQASQGGQIAAKFWIDDATGLLLRRDLFADGELVRSGAYVSLTTAKHAFLQHLGPELSAPASHLLSLRLAAALGDKGWTYPARLGGSFRLSVLRSVESGPGVIRGDYTDGLSTIALFEQRGTLAPQTLGGFREVSYGGRTFYVRDGLPMTVVWQSDSTVFTIVTDLPQQMTAGLVAGFPPAVDTSSAGDSGGVTDRVGNGLDRLVSAVRP